MSAIQPKSITIEGVTYDSYSKAEKELGLAKGSISKRLAREKAQAEADHAIGADSAPAAAEPDEILHEEPAMVAPPAA